MIPGFPNGETHLTSCGCQGLSSAFMRMNAVAPRRPFGRFGTQFERPDIHGVNQVLKA